MKMKRLATSLAVMALIVGSGAIASAQADDERESVTLFTPRLSGDHFVCSAVNVGQKTLRIDFAILGVDGQPLVPLPGNNGNPTTADFIVHPDTEAELDLTFASGIPPTDGYCKVAVSGTDDRNDVRVDLQIYWTKPILGTTTIIQLARTVQGY
jgi:hypothetical protein